MKKIGVETILFIIGIILSWMTWTTISIFSVKADAAVQENNYENIIGILKEIKSSLNK